MKKILFVTNRLIGGGSERVLVTLANEMDARGYQVSILSYRDGDSYPLRPGIRVSSLHNQRNKRKRISGIRAAVKAEKPDVVIAFEYFVNMQAILACLGLKVNLIVSERNDPAREGGSFPNRMIRNFLYRFCRTLVCQTPDAKSYFPGYVQRHTVIIPNPIRNGLPEDIPAERENKIVNFCRLQPQKNLPLLVDAFGTFRKTHGDYTMVIFGNGDLRDSLWDYIREAGLEDCICLHPSVPDVHRRVGNGAMFVSSSDYEGLSNSMIEAMAIGLPTICTDCPVGGARMVIEDGVNGLLVPVGSREALTAAMCRVADDPALAERLSRNGRKLRQELSVGDIANRWEQLF